MPQLNTYINPRYIPEDKETEKEKQMNAWKAILMANRRAMPETQSYRRRADINQQAGLDATLYETRRRNQREQAYLERQQRNLENMQARQIRVGAGPGSYQNYNIPGGSTNTGNINIPGASGTFGKFLAAISGQESGGNYSARNRSSGAMGKYQIMPSNIRGSGKGWDYEALGRDISEAQFMASPQLQEAIARYKLQQYYNKYGARGAAIAWYAGPGALKYKNLNSNQGAYPSINNYANSILRRMGL